MKRATSSSRWGQPKTGWVGAGPRSTPPPNPKIKTKTLGYNCAQNNTPDNTMGWGRWKNLCKLWFQFEVSRWKKKHQKRSSNMAWSTKERFGFWGWKIWVYQKKLPLLHYHNGTRKQTQTAPRSHFLWGEDGFIQPPTLTQFLTLAQRRHPASDMWEKKGNMDCPHLTSGCLQQTWHQTETKPADGPTNHWKLHCGRFFNLNF